MSFLTLRDYTPVLGDNAFNNIIKNNETELQMAEKAAFEEISGYLRPTYDTAAIFAAETDRNPLIVGIAVDITLYHLYASLPQKMGSEVREERYRRAIKWLEGVARGIIVPDLPTMADGVGSATALYTSQPPLSHNW